MQICILHFLPGFHQSLMLSIAKDLLEEEEREREEERGRYMAENCPTLSLPRTMQELQVRPQKTELIYIYK